MVNRERGIQRLCGDGQEVCGRRKSVIRVHNHISCKNAHGLDSKGELIFSG